MLILYGNQDGTGRLQTVRANANPLFHRLLTRFHELTGLPVLINTSLNVMGRPIVHGAEDAVALLYTSALRHLFVGRTLLRKN